VRAAGSEWLGGGGRLETGRQDQILPDWLREAGEEAEADAAAFRARGVRGASKRSVADGQHGAPGSAGLSDLAALGQTGRGDFFQHLSGQLLESIESGLIVPQSVVRECRKPERDLGRLFRELVHLLREPIPLRPYSKGIPARVRMISLVNTAC
jgi:hypothetical protein